MPILPIFRLGKKHWAAAVDAVQLEMKELRTLRLWRLEDDLVITGLLHG